MRAIVNEIPDDVSEWPSWLEHQIIGLNLFDLVVGLKATSSSSNSKAASGSTNTLEQVCGNQLKEIFKSGLGVLSTEQIRLLFKNPELLLELQERVLVDGGSYWSSLEPSQEEKKIIEKHVATTIERIGERKGIDSFKQENVSTRSSSNHRLTKPKNWKNAVERYWQVLAIAAALLIAIGIWRPWLKSEGGGWGFDQSGLLTADVTGRSYLNSLSKAAGAFSNKTPDSKESTLARLKQFRAGCEKLISAPNLQLENEVDRKWLVSKCKDWATKIDGHIADLEQKGKQWQDVLQDAKETARKMEIALKDKAVELAI